MKLKAKIIAIIVAACVFAGIVTLCVTLGKNCGGSSETVSASEQTSEIVSVSESETASETESETNSETNSEKDSESEKESESEGESKSGEESKSEEHTHSGGESTCTKKAVCEVCGEEYGEKAPHDFSVETAEEKYLANAATCEKAAEFYVSCAVCGEKGEETFENGEALGHKPAQATQENVIPATCASAGSYDIVVKCSVCNKIISSEKKFTSAYGHDYGRSKYISDGKGGHYKICSRCKAKSATAACSGGEATCKELAVCSACGGKYGKTAEHSYTKEVAEAKYLAEAATCVSAAKYYKLCEFCGETGDETFEVGEASGHSLSEDFVSLGNGKHAKVCANCDYTEEEADCAGGEATCTAKAVCAICREEYGATPAGHTWNDGEITTAAACEANGVKTFACSVCGETKTEVIESNGHIYAETVVDPGCVTKGYTRHVCGACGDTYTDSETEPKGHEWDKNAVTCTEGRACRNCDATEPASGHNYIFDRIGQEATCTEAASEIHKCTNCNDEQTVITGSPNGHTPVADPDKDIQVGAGSCYYIKGYRCSVCLADISQDKNEEISKHKCVASIKTSATCKTVGEKEYICEYCNEVVKTEEIPVDTVNGHVWNDGVSDGNGKKTFTCTVENCGATKTVIDATETKETVVSADDITADTSEIHLDGASMDLGEVKDKLTGDVTVGAGIIDPDDTRLSEEDKLKIGNSPIYDFTLKNDGENVNFDGGKVKVVLPYTLSEGEDVDNIIIWYIGDDGKTTNIEATYYEAEGKGYVTFDAEHFSYYTVTRLTPEERCRLYGHAEHDFVIVPTCTDGGYTLHVCLRCGNERKTDEKEAAGHNYSQNTTDATCLNDGRIDYKCADCNSTYSRIIKATGHDWNITENVIASCEHSGYTVYTCGNCKDSYTVTEAQKSHTFEEKTVAPTCENAGYTEKTCKECNYSYKENYVQAIGHNYKASWRWSDDNLSATLCMTCENDSTHIVEIAAVVTSVETKATCTSPAKIAYGARAEFNGELYADKKDVVTGEETLEHKFAEGYAYDDENHYRECILCGYIAEEAEHELSDGEIIKSATCSSYGEKVYVCETCGYVRKDVIPATGEHYYINGACAYCGAEYTACDHKTLTPKLLTSEDLGICEGSTFIVLTCACGKVKKLDMESVRLQCDIDGDDETSGSSESGKTADGKYYEKFTVLCKKCGAIFEEYMQDPDGDCMYGYTGYIKITKNNVVTLNAIAESIEHHPSKIEIEQIKVSDLTNEKVCGGYITVGKCAECGEYANGFSAEDLACTSIFGKEPAEFEYIDKNGVVHAGMYVACDECGLKLIEDETYVSLNSCLAYGKFTYKVIVNEEVIFEFVMGERILRQHEYEETYELLGETCEDGVKFINTCKKCGAIETYVYHGHRSSTAERIDMPENTCGGYIEQSRCDYCGETFNVVERVYEYHTFNVVKEEKITDENKIEHTVTHYKCYVCGLESISDKYKVPREDNQCELFVYTDETISFEGKVICTYTEVYGQDIHKFEYTARLKEGSKTCEDGIILERTCKVCGKSYEEGDYKGHYKEFESITLPEDTCGGNVGVYRCIACEEIVDIIDFYDLYNHSFGDGEVEWYTDENNHEHQVYTEICARCGLERSEDTITLAHDDNPCEYTVYRTRTLTAKDKTVILTCSDSYGADTHKFVYDTFELEGTTCDDGWTVKGKCVICGKEDERSGYGHERFWVEYYDFTDYGGCGGFIFKEVCACGEDVNVAMTHPDYIKEDFEAPLGEGEYAHTKTFYTCKNCEFKIEGEKISKKVSDKKTQTCNIYTDVTWHVTVGDKVVADFLVKRVGSEHTFKFTGELKDGASSCDEGNIIYGTCVDCGYSEIYYNDHSGHYTAWETIELPGECGGTLRVTRCVVCEEVMYFDYYDLNNHTFSCVDQKTYTENGIEHSYYLYRCEKCGLERSEDTYSVPKDGSHCEFVVYITKTLTSEDKTINYSYVESYNSERHQYVYTFELNGTSCEDGWTATGKCLLCEKEVAMSGNNHDEFTVAYYDLAILGACEDSYVGKYSCACGMYQNFMAGFCEDMKAEDFEIKPADDEYVHTRRTLSCEKCGLKIEEERIGKKVSDKDAHTCNIYYTTTGNVAIGETGVANIEVYNVDTSRHTFKETYKLKKGSKTCDDGIMVYRECVDCGYTDSYENHGHLYNIVETHTLNSACGGTAYYMECPCRKEKNVEYSCNCEFHEYNDEGEVDGAIESGTFFYFNVGSLRGYDGTYYRGNFLLEHTMRLWNYRSIRKCAVTNPQQCGYVIRFFNYWVKTDNCTATRYITWQFGYNEDGTCEWEKTIATDEVCAYHDFERTDINEDGVSGYDLKCKDCDSYFNFKEYRNAKDEVERVEIVSENLADNGGIKKHTHTIELDVENDYRYGFEICTIIDADGEKHVSTRTRSAYEVGGGFTAGIKTIVETDKYYYETIHACHEIKNGNVVEVELYRKTIENKDTENEQVEEWTYTYDFDNCKRTVVYKNGESEKTWEEVAHLDGLCEREVKEATCSQYGKKEIYCANCGEITDTFIISPDHAWVKVAENRYICIVCGLENVNGVSGNIVMEDLTDYENGEDYVVGYYFIENSIDKYNLVVSLVRKTASGDENDEIYLEMSAADFVVTTEGVVSVSFKKALAERLASAKLAELGLEMNDYNVRFSFTPIGFKENLDYAITFEKIEHPSEINGNGKTECIFKREELENGVEISFTPTENCDLVLSAPELYVNNYWGRYTVYYDLSINVFDISGEAVNEDNFDACRSGCRYLKLFKVEAGQTYKIKISLLDADSKVNFIPVAISGCTDVIYNYGHKLNGKKIDSGTVIIFADTDAFKSSGVKLFANTELSCEEEGAGCFTCEDCKWTIAVKVRLAHNHD